MEIDASIIEEMSKASLTYEMTYDLCSEILINHLVERVRFYHRWQREYAEFGNNSGWENENEHL